MGQKVRKARRIGNPVQPIHHLVDQIKDRLRGAERHIQRNITQRMRLHGSVLLKVQPYTAHHHRISPLKGIDGLLEITDNKQGATCRRVIHRGVKKRIAQPAQQLPLRRTGVLRLIDEQMPYGIIQFPCHPFGGIAACQHVICQRNQIIKVQQAKPGLQTGIGLMKGMAIGVKRHCQFAAALVDTPCHEGNKCGLHTLQNSDNIGQHCPHFLV